MPELSVSLSVCACAALHQLAEEVAEARAEQEAPAKVRPLLPEGRVGGQVRRRAVRQLQAPQLAQQLPAERRRLLQPVPRVSGAG